MTHWQVFEDRAQVLGKTTPSMLVLMGIIETMLFWVNSWIVFTQLGAHDVGGGMVTEGVDMDQRTGSDLQSVPCIAFCQCLLSPEVVVRQKW